MYKVILFYKFVDIRCPQDLMTAQRELCEYLNLKGRILIAEEGINGTLEGTEENINGYMEILKDGKMEGWELFKNMSFKESEGNGKAFTRLQVVVKPEVVTMGAGKFDIKNETAPTVTADELHEMYMKKEKGEEDFVILDLRNDYEINVGKFDGTVNDELGFSLQNFRDLPNRMEKLKDLKNKKVVTVCTGDIRCEKATCLLKREGFQDLYHLQDGIHSYMQKFPAKRFKGSLFVFDNRMTTPVVDSPFREIIGRCVYCASLCEDFYSNDTVRPSRKVICCPKCAEAHSSELRKCVA